MEKMTKFGKKKKLSKEAKRLAKLLTSDPSLLVSAASSKLFKLSKKCKVKKNKTSKNNIAVRHNAKQRKNKKAFSSQKLQNFEKIIEPKSKVKFGRSRPKNLIIEKDENLSINESESSCAPTVVMESDSSTTPPPPLIPAVNSESSPSGEQRHSVENELPPLLQLHVNDADADLGNWRSLPRRVKRLALSSPVANKPPKKRGRPKNMNNSFITHLDMEPNTVDEYETVLPDNNKDDVMSKNTESSNGKSQELSSEHHVVIKSDENIEFSFLPTELEPKLVGLSNTDLTKENDITAKDTDTTVSQGSDKIISSSSTLNQDELIRKSNSFLQNKEKCYGTEKNMKNDIYDLSVNIKTTSMLKGMCEYTNLKQMDKQDDSLKQVDIFANLKQDNFDEVPKQDNLDDNLKQDHLDNRLKQDHLDNRLKQDHLDNRLKQDHLDNSLKQDHLDNSLKQDHLDNSLKQDHLDNSLKQDHLDNTLKQNHLDNSVMQDHLDDSPKQDHLDDSSKEVHLDDSPKQGHLNENFKENDFDSNIMQDHSGNSLKQTHNVDNSLKKTNNCEDNNSTQNNMPIHKCCDDSKKADNSDDSKSDIILTSDCQVRSDTLKHHDNSESLDNGQSGDNVFINEDDSFLEDPKKSESAAESEIQLPLTPQTPASNHSQNLSFVQSNLASEADNSIESHDSPAAEVNNSSITNDQMLVNRQKDIANFEQKNIIDGGRDDEIKTSCQVHPALGGSQGAISSPSLATTTNVVIKHTPTSQEITNLGVYTPDSSTNSGYNSVDIDVAQLGLESPTSISSNELAQNSVETPHQVPTPQPFTDCVQVQNSYCVSNQNTPPSALAAAAAAVAQAHAQANPNCTAPASSNASTPPLHQSSQHSTVSFAHNPAPVALSSAIQANIINNNPVNTVLLGHTQSVASANNYVNAVNIGVSSTSNSMSASYMVGVPMTSVMQSQTPTPPSNHHHSITQAAHSPMQRLSHVSMPTTTSACAVSTSPAFHLQSSNYNYASSAPQGTASCSLAKLQQLTNGIMDIAPNPIPTYNTMTPPPTFNPSSPQITVTPPPQMQRTAAPTISNLQTQAPLPSNPAHSYPSYSHRYHPRQVQRTSNIAIAPNIVAAGYQALNSVSYRMQQAPTLGSTTAMLNTAGYITNTRFINQPQLPPTAAMQMGMVNVNMHPQGQYQESIQQARPQNTMYTYSYHINGSLPPQALNSMMRR